MKEQITAKAYARSLMQLGEESKVDIAKELTTFTELINSNNDLENVLFLDVFTVEEKKSVIESLLGKVKLSPLLKNILFFLVEEKRINLMPLIFKEVIVIDDHNKGFLRGTIEGHKAILPDNEKDVLVKFLEQQLNKKIQLDYVQKENVTAGYKVIVEDLQLDATIDNQLEKLKENILAE